MKKTVMLVVMFIIIISAGIYNFGYRDINLKIEKRADSNEKSDENNSKYIENYLGNTVLNGTGNNLNEKNAGVVNNNKYDTSKVEQDESDSSPEQMEALIVEKYEGLFASLKEEYEGKLSELLKKAKDEYLSLSEEEKASQRFQLVLKYLKLADSLERKCDEEFYLLLDEMKKELKIRDLKDDWAKKAEKQYKSEKATRRQQLIESTLKNI